MRASPQEDFAPDRRHHDIAEQTAECRTAPALLGFEKRAGAVFGPERRKG